MTDQNSHLIRLLEATLFASAAPLTERVLSNRLPEGSDIKGLLKEVQDQYAGRGVNLVKVGGSWAFRTAEDLAAQMIKNVELVRKLSRAAIETLAIIAYHQPITRAEIEEVRGVSLSKGTLDILLEEGWIKPRGRKDAPGRPLYWGTTDGFLDHFGLESLRDLPGVKELKAMGLLESGPALNVYRSHGELTEEAAAVDTEIEAVSLDSTDPADDDAVEELDPDDGLESIGQGSAD